MSPTCAAHSETVELARCEGEQSKQSSDPGAEARMTALLSARAADRLSVLGEMTGGIAHDFRNILAIIDTSLRLLTSNTNDPQMMQMLVTGARVGVDRGLKLTSRLLSLARQGEVSAQPGDANELLRNLGLFLKYGAGPAIGVVLELAADLPKCVVNPAEFNSAILNLVVNARDAMPNGGEIHISTSRVIVETASTGTPKPGTYARVTVADNGQGMSEDVKRKIFEPFFTTKGEKGTGLGLPQLYASMQRVGGHVHVASEPRHGTRFELLFPAA